MRANHDCLALCFQFEKQVLYFFTADGIQAGGRFVEEEEVWIAEERLRQPESLDHAPRKLQYPLPAHIPKAEAV